jgi:hypothetical protein
VIPCWGKNILSGFVTATSRPATSIPELWPLRVPLSHK